MSSTKFSWAEREAVIIPRQSAVAIYVADDGDIVIRQEGGESDPDYIVVLTRPSAAILAKKINELLESVNDNSDFPLTNKGEISPSAPVLSANELRENWAPPPYYDPLEPQEQPISPDTSEISAIENNKELNKELEEAIEAYNATAKLIGLPECKRLTQRRKTSLKARLGYCGGLAGWAQALEKLADSPWCRGQNERGWRADIDFLLNERSFTKLWEGSYAGHMPRESMDADIFRSRAPVMKPEPDKRSLKTEEERKAFVEQQIKGNSHG